MRLLIFNISFLIFLSGCSNHKLIKDKLSKKDISIVVIDIDNQLNKNAKEANLGYAIAENLKRKLENEKDISVIKRPQKPTFKEERRLVQKGRGVNYIISGSIDSTSTREIYYPPRKRSEGGMSSGWTEYRACVSGSIKIFKPPFSQSNKTIEFNHICVKQNNKNYIEMLTRTAPKVVDETLYDLEEFFVKQ